MLFWLSAEPGSNPVCQNLHGVKIAPGRGIKSLAMRFLLPDAAGSA
jgi:hypothetical protein